MSTKQQDQANAIFEMLDIVRQHRWRFVLPAFAVTASVLCICLFLPRKYQATAHFERRNDPVLTELTDSGASDNYMDPAGSIMKEIASGPAIATALSEVEPELRARGYIKAPSDMDRLRTQLMQQLVVNRDYADNVRIQIHLELVLDDPNVAALLVNTLVDNYIEKTRTALMGSLGQMAATFREQEAAHRAELESLENRRLAFEIEHAELLPEHPFSIQNQLNSAESEVADLLTQIEGIDLRITRLQEAIDAEPMTIPSVVHGRNPELERLEEKLRIIDEDIDEHVNVMRMRETHPDVIALHRQADEVRSEIAALDLEVVTSTEHSQNPKRSDMELQLNSFAADRDALNELVAARRERIGELNIAATDLLPIRSEYRKLESEVEAAKRDIAYWADRLRGVEMSLTAESGDRGVQLNFLSPAQPNRRPVSPNLAQAILAAFFLGTAAGALNIFFAHRTDDTFRNDRRLANATTLPILGAVSELITRRHRRLRKLRRYLLYPAQGSLMVGALVLAAGLLYMDLERPETLIKFKDKATTWVADHWPSQDTKDSAVGMIDASPKKN